MYVPAAFRQADTDALHALIRDNNFGTLVSVVDGQLFATHLPFLLDAGRGPFGTLVAHLARPNPHWHSFSDPNVSSAPNVAEPNGVSDSTATDDATVGPQALAIFTGPHAYISPRWYATELSVPTWNYTAVHAYGVPSIVHDPTRVRAILDRLVRAHEPSPPDGWDTERLPPEYVTRMAQGVVAFEMPISSLQGKWKLGQNRPSVDIEGAARGLLATNDDLAGRVATLMSGALAPDG